MRALRSGLAALVLAPFLAIASPDAGAEDPEGPVTLRCAFAKGDRWSIDESLAFDFTFTAGPSGKSVESMVGGWQHLYRGELTVLDASPGRLEAARVRFGVECSTGFRMGTSKDEAKTVSLLAGREVTVTRRSEGPPSIEGVEDLPEDETTRLSELLTPPAGWLPSRPVKAGDRWVADERALASTLSWLGKSAAGDVHHGELLLREVRVVEGRRVAEIDAKVLVVLSEKDGGTIWQYELAGALALDVRTGIPLSVDLHGTGKLTGATTDDETDGGVSVRLPITGTAAVRYRSGLAAREDPPAFSTSFGHLRFTPPSGWTSTAYANGVVLQPTDLPPGGHLNVTVMPAMAWTGTLDDAMKWSWDDAATQLALEKTATVDGPSYRKGQSGTSFRGWEYARADGTLHSEIGDYATHLFLVRAVGRVERILVTSKEKSYRGQSTSYEDPRYYDRIQAFLFSLRFDDVKDPPPVVPATLVGDGIVGVWTGITASTGSPGGAYAIFFSNGQAYFADKFPIHGLDGLDTWIDREMRPRDWGTYAYVGDAGVLRSADRELPLRGAAGALVLTTPKGDQKYVRLASPDGLRLDGTWVLASDPSASKARLTFTPAGRFEDFGAVNFLNHRYPLTEAPGKGAYEVRNRTLVLRFDDGREVRIAYPGLGQEKGDPRPARLVLSFNEDVLVRQ